MSEFRSDIDRLEATMVHFVNKESITLQREDHKVEGVFMRGKKLTGESAIMNARHITVIEDIELTWDPQAGWVHDSSIPDPDTKQPKGNLFRDGRLHG